MVWGGMGLIRRWIIRIILIYNSILVFFIRDEWVEKKIILEKFYSFNLYKICIFWIEKIR